MFLVVWIEPALSMIKKSYQWAFARWRIPVPCRGFWDSSSAACSVHAGLWPGSVPSCVWSTCLLTLCAPAAAKCQENSVMQAFKEAWLLSCVCSLGSPGAAQIRAQFIILAPCLFPEFHAFSPFLPCSILALYLDCAWCADGRRKEEIGKGQVCFQLLKTVSSFPELRLSPSLLQPLSSVTVSWSAFWGGGARLVTLDQAVSTPRRGSYSRRTAWAAGSAFTSL